MKILFVLPYQNDTLEPLGAMYLAAMLKQAGHEVRAALPNKQSVIAVLRSFPADILAYSVITGAHQQYLALNWWIRKNLLPNAMSVFGGPHPTYFPKFIDNDGVNAICIGEGEGAFLDFVTRLERGEDFFLTRNWWVKYQGRVYQNPLRPEITDLDGLPFPDRRLLDACPSYINRNLRAFIASRGCPYNCSYCFNPAYRELYQRNGLTARVRRRTVDNLIAEINHVRQRHGMRSVTFFDDIFVTVPDWLEEFAIKYSQQIGLPFECNLRIEQVTPKTVSALKRAGCAIVAIGVETADEEMRATILRRRYDNDQLAQACALIQKHDILLKTYNILGFPPGDINSDLQTLKLNIVLRIDVPTASLFQPYPGTDLGDMVRREGYWDGSMDSIDPSFYRESPLVLKDKAKIEVLQKFFFLGVRFPKTMPLIRLCLALANVSWFRHFIFFAYRISERISFFAGERIVAYEPLRRLALRMRRSNKCAGD